MKKADLIIIGIALFVTITFFGVKGLNKYYAIKNSKSIYVEIQVKGEIYKTIQLTEETEETISIETELGNNTIIIHKGIVEMYDADCRDQICVNEKPMSKIGDIIVCLPHKVVVEIKGNKEANIDAVSN
ncbi:flavin-based extracellular electron transfer system protein EetA [Clostridium sediminicola]|uniref:NusG domain II-containing protein n=1 Tax=Clostridium sediminicola TaxID=3114879 RepID=UPI0031F1C909